METIGKNKISLMFLVICKSIKQKWWELFVRIYLINWFTVFLPQNTKEAPLKRCKKILC